MKIYKNPFVKREHYFVATEKTTISKVNAHKGYIVEFLDGSWRVGKGIYYDFTLDKEFPLIAEDRTSINTVIEKAVMNAVLDLVAGRKGNNYEVTK